MSESVLTNNGSMIDKKIEQFCQSSAELLAKIHDRCGNMTKTTAHRKAKMQKRRTAREKDNQLEELPIDFNTEEHDLDSAENFDE
jgi:hypothetical protein